jgi:hypothetical protein
MKQLVNDLNCEVTVGHFGTDNRNLLGQILTNTNINSYATIYPVGLWSIGLYKV